MSRAYRALFLFSPAAALVLGGAGPARADEPRPPAREPPTVPKWELGLGFTALTLPDYRGADRSRQYVLPIPYGRYQSERFSADRNGLRAELLDRGRLELDLSLAASAPVRSSGNPARLGMPGLRPTLEVGPQLLANLWRSADGNTLLQAQFPVRYVFAISGEAHDVGVTFNPRVMLDFRNLLGYRDWNVAVIGGPMFATRRHHDYYYSVDPAYATATRPAYQAEGGFGGYQMTFGLSKRFARHWLGGFVRIDWLDGATFEDSPLVRQRQVVAAGIAFSVIFAQSEERVPFAR